MKTKLLSPEGSFLFGALTRELTHDIIRSGSRLMLHCKAGHHAALLWGRLFYIWGGWKTLNNRGTIFELLVAI